MSGKSFQSFKKKPRVLSLSGGMDEIEGLSLSAAASVMVVTHETASWGYIYCETYNGQTVVDNS